MHASETTIRVEISVAIMTRLLADGHLRATDLRCLDCASMHCLRRSCLRSCVWATSGRCRSTSGHGQCPAGDKNKEGVP